MGETINVGGGAALADNSVTSAKILDGEIVNADVSASAAIAWTKVSKSGAVASDVGAQGSDATLTALAAFNSNGILTQTAADTFAARTITGTTNLIDVTDGNGVLGNPTITIGANVYRSGGTDVAIADGGTGVSTLPTGLLYGNGTSAITGVDYETNTYTPVITLVGGAGNTVPVYVTATGRYFKIGKRVFVGINFSGDGGAEGAGTGQINISLPLTSLVGGQTQPFRGLAYSSTSPSYYDLVGIVDTGVSTLNLFYMNSFPPAGLPNFTGADQSGTTRFIFINFWYEV